MSISFENFSHKLPLPFFYIALVYKLNNRWRCTCKPDNLNELNTTIPYPKNNSYLVYSLSRYYLNYHSKLLTNLLQSTFNPLHSNNFLKNSTSISNLMVYQNPSLTKAVLKPFTISLIILIIERWKGKTDLHLKIQNSSTLFLDRFPLQRKRNKFLSKFTLQNKQ